MVQRISIGFRLLSCGVRLAPACCQQGGAAQCLNGSAGVGPIITRTNACKRARGGSRSSRAAVREKRLREKAGRRGIHEISR
jgi:hypothetical protein